MSDSIPEPNGATQLAIPTHRHDGWSGEAMAAFLENLAETGVVAEACDEAGKSRTAAYALRRRDPLFAAAWERALDLARERLADTLLARSLEGNVEQIWKDGTIVAEKHFLDNRLGLAILKRLDQRAEPRAIARPRAAAATRAEPDWEMAVDALRTGNQDDIAAALAMVRAGKVDEVDNPLFGSGTCQLCAADLDDDLPDPPIHCWRDGGEWWTDFPPPEGFADMEWGKWGSRDYKRLCTDEELAILEAGHELDRIERLEQAQAERERYFADYAAAVVEDGGAELVERIKAALSSDP